MRRRGERGPTERVFGMGDILTAQMNMKGGVNGVVRSGLSNFRWQGCIGTSVVVR